MSKPINKVAQVDAVEALFKKFLAVMQVPRNNPEVDIENTPKRVARMYVNELLSGYDPLMLETLRKSFTVFNRGSRHELVVIRNVPFYSLCSHHLLPWFGTAALGYLPAKHVIGLSKFPRGVKALSRRLQTQEILTGEIADFVMDEAEPEALIVHLNAVHLCCAARGIERPGTEMLTTAIRPQETFPVVLRDEFYRMMGMK